jgi:hypothetical protein
MDAAKQREETVIIPSDEELEQYEQFCRTVCDQKDIKWPKGIYLTPVLSPDTERMGDALRIVKAMPKASERMAQKEVG